MEASSLLARPAAAAARFASSSHAAAPSSTSRLFLSGSYSSRSSSNSRSSIVAPLVFRRTKATTRRTKKALNIPPHPSFLASPDTTSSSVGDTAQDHVVFNPPSSEPSVYHTPFKFLPKSDPRRRANLTALFRNSATIDYSAAPSTPSSSTPTSSPEGATGTAELLPPQLDVPKPEAKAYPRHHLSKEDVAEIRRLRAEDPVGNSVLALARRFNTGPLFVMMCCKAPQEKRDADRARLDAVKARWGPIRAQAREDRRRRRGMLYRGEL